MIIDQSNIKSRGRKLIEVMTAGPVKVWIPIMATKLYLVQNDGNLVEVVEARCRRLEDDNNDKQ